MVRNLGANSYELSDSQSFHHPHLHETLVREKYASYSMEGWEASSHMIHQFVCRNISGQARKPIGDWVDVVYAAVSRFYSPLNVGWTRSRVSIEPPGSWPERWRTGPRHRFVVSWFQFPVGRRRNATAHATETPVDSRLDTDPDPDGNRNLKFAPQPLRRCDYAAAGPLSLHYPRSAQFPCLPRTATFLATALIKADRWRSRRCAFLRNNNNNNNNNKTNRATVDLFPFDWKRCAVVFRARNAETRRAGTIWASRCQPTWTVRAVIKRLWPTAHGPERGFDTYTDTRHEVRVDCLLTGAHSNTMASCSIFIFFAFRGAAESRLC